jgi:primosomal protein N' (replication factor Y) (superfamily II helicase)
MYYYEIGLGVERHWKSAFFTYSSNHRFDIGAVVRVPFGSQKKIGVIKTRVKKPEFKVKEILENYNIQLSDDTLKFADWYRDYYTAQYGQIYTQLLPHYLTKPLKSVLTIESKKNTVNKLTLSSEQQRVKNEISNFGKPSVLHGTTGSGKTRIYISLILDQLSKGKNALLLYPEIALTPQIAQELKKYAPLWVFHSKLTNSQRSKLWFQVACSTDPYIVIGARSALFLPHFNLGIIILDEAHESSYKQDSDIRYNSIMVAGGLSKIHGAKLLLGSATPPITESELILNSNGKLVCLHENAIKNTNTKIAHVIDKKNKNLFKKHRLISDALIESIDRSLKHGKQSLLFINRRGTAKLMFCNSCGWQSECPNCDLPVTYHHDIRKLLCHTCGKSITLQPACPICNDKLQLKTFGSKAIVDDIQKLFPKAIIGRYDSDNDLQDSFANNYDKIKKGDIDILIGTQQLVKGLDLPLLTTVGVLDADLSLHFPDYSSEERTFQLVSQVAGRVGRGHENGEIFIQTYQPNNPIIQFAKTENWHEFRIRELDIRKKHRFPPYVFTAKLLFRDKKIKLANNKADKATKILQKQTFITIDGPLPSYWAKKGGYYYIQLHLRSSSRLKLQDSIKKLSKEIMFDLDPITLL